jgi:hypothetical protein
VAKLDRFLQRRLRVEERPDHVLVPVHEEAQPGVPLERESRARHHDGRAVVAAHGVERNPNRLRHEGLGFRPGGGTRGK